MTTHHLWVYRAAFGAVERARILAHAVRRSEVARGADRGRTRAAGDGAVWARGLTACARIEGSSAIFCPSRLQEGWGGGVGKIRARWLAIDRFKERLKNET